MTLQYGTTLRNARQDQNETTIGTAPVIQFRTGAPPANCGSADSGTLIGSMTLPSDWMANASGGSKSKSGTWSMTTSAAGRIAHARLKDSGLTTCHMQWIVAMPWQASYAYSTGDYVTNDSGKLYKATAGGTSASSGGPTGTGASITDNGVTWAYQQAAADMTIDNAVVVSGQTVNVSTFQTTDGNA
jgi:hypothetical protein